MAEHTPGPWYVGQDDSRECVVPILCGDRDNSYEVARVCHYDGFPPGEQGDANADLIAAAPEMLGALRAVLDNAYSMIDADVLRQAEAAIAKATGCP